MSYYSPASSKADLKYKNANIKKIFISLNIKKDTDILDFMGSLDNKQGYMKRLIREDMARRAKEEPRE